MKTDKENNVLSEKEILLNNLEGLLGEAELSDVSEEIEVASNMNLGDMLADLAIAEEDGLLEEIAQPGQLVPYMNADELSDIEPESGDFEVKNSTENDAGNNNGFGFQSSVENVSLNSVDAVGALGATELGYGSGVGFVDVVGSTVPTLFTAGSDRFPSTIKVGQNASDTSSSSTEYVVGGGFGAIGGTDEADILVGDAGAGFAGASLSGDFNIVLMLDKSGSMGSRVDSTTRMQVLIDATQNLIDDFNQYSGGSIVVHMIPFEGFARTGGTFIVTEEQGYNDASIFLNNITASGGTNFVSPMSAAIAWLNGSESIADAQIFSYLITDGSGTENATTTSNLQAASDALIGIGIGSGANMTIIDRIDSSGQGVLVENPEDLNIALQSTNPLAGQTAVGGDEINGGDGNDIIFGDALFTDDLAIAQGLDMPEGSGWSVFEALETEKGWSKSDIVNYIRNNIEVLGGETMTDSGQTRRGGDDTLNGGGGDDVILGQEGDDVIRGDGGNDVLSGGSGDNTMTGGAGADTFILSHLDNGLDTVTDFNGSEGDILDISSVLGSFDPLADSISDFVLTRTEGGNTVVSVDAAGTGTGAIDLAILEGIADFDVTAAMNNGSLIV